MEEKCVDIDAQLISGRETIPILTKYSSKYSLWVRFQNGHEFCDGAEFAKLVVKVNGSLLDLGKCRLIREPNIEGFDGRLIFISDVYDFESLLKGEEVVKLQSTFQNLQLVLPYKKHIKPVFKEYTSDLTYDLSIYKNLFDRVDREHHGEPEHIRNLVQKAVIYTEGRNFMKFMDDRTGELKKLVSGFTKDEHERHGFYFRRQLWNYLLCAPILARTNLKPRGYSGDSVMMNMLYQNEYLGNTTFEKLLHKYACELEAAQAVRNRRNMIARKLSEYARRHTPEDGGRLRVFSVACGPAYELRDILTDRDAVERYHFYLFDQDKEALLEAATWIDQREKELGIKVRVDYVNESVRTMMSLSEGEGWKGSFHFIYSMGLFDYLTPPVARAVLGELRKFLTPDGELLIGNYHVENADRFFMEYWADWVLYYRTEADFQAMIPKDDRMESEIIFEDTRCQMFLHLTKRPG